MGNIPEFEKSKSIRNRVLKASNTSLIIVVLILLFLTGEAYMTVYHENVHVQIANNHGCINSTVEYFQYEESSGAIVSTTVCEQYVNRSAEMAMQERYLQSQAENLGYHMQGLYGGLFILLMMYFVIKS